ncbi:hypothetical protein [Paraclostridium bifermentans]|uniref:hypothetical protein n=1 Tax=Paraclostridium bifermentans TaxID=1490 RepID=UPI00242B18B3|nr:hypothetical protein [Paraclostridium bifermentans]
MLYTMFSLKSKLDIFNLEGTAFSSINSNDLKEITVNIPNNNDIEKFEKIVCPMDMLTHTNYEENCRLQTLRDYLLPKLISGEIDVKNIKL